MQGIPADKNIKTIIAVQTITSNLANDEDWKTHADFAICLRDNNVGFRQIQNKFAEIPDPLPVDV
ncbi:MAG: hypothetical protein M3P33_01580 [bacterium]|nr:hypothetical protein [bacterium]